MANLPCKPRYIVLALLAHGLLLWAVAGVRSTPPRLSSPAMQPVMEISLAPSLPAPPEKQAVPDTSKDAVLSKDPEPPSPVQRAVRQKPASPRPVKHSHPSAAPNKAAPPPSSPAKEQVAEAQKASDTPATAPGAPAATQPVFDAAYLNNPPPDYPRLARRMHQQGTVMLNVLVTVNGAAGEVDIAQSSGSDVLDDAARQAVKRWRFIPAKRGAETVAGWVRVPVVFRLGG
ncbi:energy transducer TonB [Acerihabitans sp. KWT182]|uniref:Energy transducer TonB n=1 Tax=Acerihabitans sp. KWT182 TaxID=3157919 RepID=A0AAU7QA11_9GAMM